MSPVRRPRPRDPDQVAVRQRAEIDDRRIRRVAEILLAILDTARTPGEGRRS